eukprot:5920776-Amphidinium_carterae.1
MEIKTTFKSTQQRIIIDNVHYTSNHFHDFSIITASEHYDPDLVISMIKSYYSAEQKEKKLQPQRQQFMTFTINKHPDDMMKLMK